MAGRIGLIVVSLLLFTTGIAAEDLPLDPRPSRDCSGLLPIMCGESPLFPEECKDPCFVLFQACSDQVSCDRLDCNYDCLLKFENDPKGLRKCASSCIAKQNLRTVQECGDLRKSCYQASAEDGKSESKVIGGLLSQN